MWPDRYGPAAADRLALRGLGMRLAGVLTPDDLARQITGRVPPPRALRLLAAAHTDLEPVRRWINGPADARMPAHVAPRGLRNLPEESRLALAAAAEASASAAGSASGPAAVRSESGPAAAGSAADAAAVLWASSSAGLAEYATICVEASILDPGLSSPVMGPASAFNGPAATISIRLRLEGPNETLTGGTTAGLSSLAEAGRILASGEAGRALVGASASVSRWSLPGESVPAATESAPIAGGGFVPAEGAACLALAPWRDGDSGVGLGRCRRLGLDPSRLRAQAGELVAATVSPGALVVSTSDIALVEALAAERAGPVWHVERALGDFGAAGGLMAVACAVAWCASGPPPATALALAIEPSGNASIVEVFSC